MNKASPQSIRLQDICFDEFQMAEFKQGPISVIASSYWDENRKLQSVWIEFVEKQQTPQFSLSENVNSCFDSYIYLACQLKFNLNFNFKVLCKSSNFVAF